MRKEDVVSEVINAAKKEACDLIIMSSHGYKGLIYSMKGSNTEKVTLMLPARFSVSKTKDDNSSPEPILRPAVRLEDSGPKLPLLSMIF